ncbi:MAG: hypothetical protein K2Q25_03325 [Mycobacteriaceae bacterium]|nr:hypothetical protein [Mycobacteriaceae bacterium]
MLGDERSISPYRRRRGIFAVVVVLVLMMAGCSAGRLAAQVLVVGSGSDSLAVLLADIYAAALRSSGAQVRVEPAPDPLTKLDSGAFDVVPSFTGAVLRALVPGASVRSAASVYQAMVGALPEGIAAGDYATAAEDKPALAVTQATAQAWGGTDLSVIPAHCGGLVIGAVAGVRTPTTVGPCRLPDSPNSSEFPDQATMFAALRSGQIITGWTTTADPDLPADLVVLVDQMPALIQAENVVPLYRRHELTNRQLSAINEVAGVLDTAALIDMRRQLGRGADAAVVAQDWLAEHPLGR